MTAILGGSGYNEALFKLLCFAQDERGRDNAGVVYHSSGKTICVVGGKTKQVSKYFKLFDWDSEMSPLHSKESVVTPALSLYELLDEYMDLPNEDLDWAMAHSRKASVGCTSVHLAHPIVYDGPSKVYLMHNGTIYNYKDLIQYLPKEAEAIESDSQLLAAAISFGKLETVLKYMKGSACILWKIDGDPNIYAYVSSKDPAAQTLVPDRPLHACLWRDSWYFSSTKEPLNKAINIFKSSGESVPDIFQLKMDHILKFSPSAGASACLDKIDRQVEKKQPAKQQNTNYYVPFKTGNSTVYDQDHPDLLKGSPFRLQYGHGKYYMNGRLCNSMYKVRQGEVIDVEPIYVSDAGQFYFQTKEGKFRDTQGVVYRGKSDVRPYYFVDGIIVKGKTSAMQLNRIKLKYNRDLRPIDFVDRCMGVIPASGLNFFYAPYFGGGNAGSIAFEGDITPLFTNFRYSYAKGKMVARTRISAKKAKQLWVPSIKYLHKYDDSTLSKEEPTIEQTEYSIPEKLQRVATMMRRWKERANEYDAKTLEYAATYLDARIKKYQRKDENTN